MMFLIEGKCWRFPWSPPEEKSQTLLRNVDQDDAEKRATIHSALLFDPAWMHLPDENLLPSHRERDAPRLASRVEMCTRPCLHRHSLTWTLTCTPSPAPVVVLL